MRWVDRGPEPAGVAEYARQFTQGWVDYFQKPIEERGQRPADSHWRGFRSVMGSRTNNICWYCERQCNVGAESGGSTPTVDHFRPLSRFPRLAYEWSNWIFSCQRCNHNKANKWPDLGYVNPCAADASDRPDRYFDYDMLTGDIVPKRGLPSAAQRRAWDTIDDLGLNNLDVKIHRLECIQEFWNGVTSQQFSYRQTFITLFTEQPVEYAGAIGMLVEQLRQAGRI